MILAEKKVGEGRGRPRKVEEGRGRWNKCEKVRGSAVEGGRRWWELVPRAKEVRSTGVRLMAQLATTTSAQTTMQAARATTFDMFQI